MNTPEDITGPDKKTERLSFEQMLDLVKDLFKAAAERDNYAKAVGGGSFDGFA